MTEDERTDSESDVHLVLVGWVSHVLKIIHEYDDILPRCASSLTFSVSVDPLTGDENPQPEKGCFVLYMSSILECWYHHATTNP